MSFELRPWHYETDIPDIRDHLIENSYPLYFSSRGWFTRFNFFAAFALVTLVCSFWHPAFVGVTIATVVVVYLSYLIGRRSAEGLTIKRELPDYVISGQKLNITYRVQNHSPLPLSSFLLTDQTSLSSQGDIALFWTDTILPWTQQPSGLSLDANAGIGAHNLHSLTVYVRDPLHIFEFKVSSEREDQIQVIPKIEEMLDLQLMGSPSSAHAGLIQKSARGSSIDFMGVREYSTGDPYKLISWKMTARHGRLMVKEFEKTISAETTVLIDMNAHAHAGTRTQNSWEYVKRLGLNLIGEIEHDGGYFQLLSQNVYLPMGAGPNHLKDATIAVMDMHLVETDSDLLSRVPEFAPLRSTIMYVCPLFRSYLEIQKPLILNLLGQDYEVFLFLVDIIPHIKSEVPADYSGLLMGDTMANSTVDRDFLEDLESRGAHIYRVPITHTWTESFRLAEVWRQRLREGAA